MKYYKIRLKGTEKYSQGSTSPSFSKKGKTWTSLQNLRLHLLLFIRSGENLLGDTKYGFYHTMNDIEVVELEMKETKTLSPCCINK